MYNMNLCIHMNTYLCVHIWIHLETVIFIRGQNIFINMNTYVYVHDEFMYTYEYVSICPHMNAFSDYPPIHMRTEYIHKYEYMCMSMMNLCTDMNTYLYVHIWMHLATTLLFIWGQNIFINMNTYVYIHDEFMYTYEYVSICPHMNAFSDYPPIHMKTEYIHKYEYICVCPWWIYVHIWIRIYMSTYECI